MRPGKPGFRIKHIWAFIATDPADDSEGIPAFLGRDGAWHPLEAADEDRLTDMRKIAVEMAKKGGVKMRLVRFDSMVDVETIEP